MYVTKEMLLSQLPPNQEKYVVVSSSQSVPDIIGELVDGYPINKKFYDKIGMFFKGATLLETCDNLYDFCKLNLEYREEAEAWQVHAPPQGLLDRGYCDCKGYASFIGGCLGAISRATGEDIDWSFYFASYDPDQQMPYHVFVTVNGGADGEIWVDPTPGSDGMQPAYEIVEKPAEVAGLVAAVNPAGELVYQGKIGATSSLNVPPSAIPLPTGYPAGIPQPYVTNGKIQLTPVPPNFDPSPEQVAWMMWALQVWVVQYGTVKYNVFQWRWRTDGTGSGIASFVSAFCNQYNPQMLKMLQQQQINMMFDHYKTFDQVQALNSQIFMLNNIMNFDFGNPPDHYMPDAFEKIMDTIAITVLQYASNLLPVIGPAYANFWLKGFLGDANDAATFNSEATQAAAQIAQQQQAVVDDAAKKKQIGNYILIGVALLTLYWVYDTYE